MDSEETLLDDIRIGEQTKLWAVNRHMAVDYAAENPSTNDWAKKEAFSTKIKSLPLKVYLTDLQTAGRGRGPNQWIASSSGRQLCMSWSVQLENPPHPTLSAKIGYAVWSSLKSTWAFLPWSLKAPNDIYLGNKKIAGLLIENIIQGNEVRCILGLGMNVLESPRSVKTATSLMAELPEGAPLLAEDWFDFLDRLSLEFSMALSQCDNPLTTTQQKSLLKALNDWPGLTTLYTQLDENGNLLMGSKKIPWMDI